MELRQQLLDGVRGSSLTPGRLREVQVHIGSHRDDLASARFVPPPPDFVRDLLENLCTYISAEDDLPLLARLAVIHYQFETIHPFMDGNGRIGRLIMPLILREWGYLEFPLLYLSEYFEENRETYIDLMLAVSQKKRLEIMDSVRSRRYRIPGAGSYAPGPTLAHAPRAPESPICPGPSSGHHSPDRGWLVRAPCNHCTTSCRSSRNHDPRRTNCPRQIDG